MTNIMRPETVFATIATADRSDAGVGVIWFAHTPRGKYLLTVLDYDISSMKEVSGYWIRALFERGAELAKERRALDPGCVVWCERGGLLDLMRAACKSWLNSSTSRALPREAYDFCEVPYTKSAEWPPSIDARAELIRPLVNSGTFVKFEGARKFGFRALRVNHLASQLKAHQPGVPGTAGELVHALTLGILLARDGDARPYLPEFPEAESRDEGPLARVAAMFRHAIPAVIVPRITPKHRQQAKRIAWEREFEHRAQLIYRARGEPGWRARSCIAVSMPPAPLLPGQQLSTNADDPHTPDPPPETAAFARLLEAEISAYATGREQFIAQLNRLYPGRLPL